MHLGPSDRQVFAAAGATLFSNPFQAPLKGGSTAAKQVAERVEQLESADIRLYGAEDRRVLVIALLAEAYERFCGSLDAVIEEQLALPERPVQVTPAADFLDHLQRRGFTADGARHFLAIFHQMRRAHRFIGAELVGSGPAMHELKRRLWNNIFSADIATYERQLWHRLNNFPTLLAGEIGTGKSAAAFALARSGYIAFDEARGTFARSFMSCLFRIHAGRLSDTDLDAQLFGPQGALAQCGAGGTVFLDSIESLSATAQARLLHALEGGFEGRLVAATSRPTAALRQEGKLRDDLYYRLAADAIPLPTLRQRLEERPADRDELLQVLVTRITGRPGPAQVEQIAKALDQHPGQHYAWPGNVLELDQAVRRVLLNGRYDGDAQAAAPDLLSQLLASVRDGTASAEDLLAGYCQLLHRRHGTYEAVAEIAKLDRRTAKKYVLRYGRE